MLFNTITSFSLYSLAGKSTSVPTNSMTEDTTPPAIKEKKISFREGDKVIADDLVEVDDFSETSLYLYPFS